MKWVPDLPIDYRSPPDRWMEWLTRQFRKLSDWSESVPSEQQSQLFLGGYDASTNLVVGGTYNGQVLPAAAGLNPGEYFLVVTGGTLSTLPNAPEINGQTVAPNDTIVVSSTGYILLTATTAFLSRVTPDTAAGKITFAVGADSSIAPTLPNDLTRKAYVDGGDTTVQSNLDSHIGHLYSSPDDPHGIQAHTDVTDIHFSDAPNDGDVYARQSLAWLKMPPPDIGALYGTTDAFTMGTSPTVLLNYASSGENGNFVGNVHSTSGLIIIPETGLYRIKAWVFGTQGNNTKEETMRLGLRIVNTVSQDGDYPKWAFDVATDKTNERSFMFSQTLSLPQMAFLALYMNATASMGTFTVVDTTFEIERLIL